MKKRYKRFTFDLDEQIHRELKIIAANAGKTLRSIMTDLVNALIKNIKEDEKNNDGKE